jgi:hypothetical protein
MLSRPFEKGSADTGTPNIGTDEEVIQYPESL